MGPGFCWEDRMWCVGRLWGGESPSTTLRAVPLPVERGGDGVVILGAVFLCVGGVEMAGGAEGERVFPVERAKDWVPAFAGMIGCGVWGGCGVVRAPPPRWARSPSP